MTIRKGSDYGSSEPLPDGAPVVSSDAVLHEVIAEAWESSSLPVTVGLLGGDLCRTLGGNGDHDHLFATDARTVPIDLVVVAIDGKTFPVVSHLIAGRLFGENFLAVMNAQWWGRFDLGPRSHPGDGLVDVTRGRLPLRQRVLARQRSHSGTHLPHPQLTYKRVSSMTTEFSRPTEMVIDNDCRVTGRSLTVTVEPDAFFVVI